MIENHYNLSNKYNKTIALFADIHYSKKYPLKNLKKIIENIKFNKPDYICIPGDIIDDATIIEEKEIEYLINFIKELSKISKVILSYGNHDELIIEKHKLTYKNTTSFFKKLNKIKNVYFLDNENIIIDDINFIGYHKNYLLFQKYEKLDMTKDLKNIENKFIKNKYNILLAHSPINILNYNLKTDLILSGHMHNGLVLPIFKKGNNGIVGPYSSFFPKNCRGKITKNNTNLIINGGVRKISNSSSFILRLLNPIYKEHIDYIKI